ncbi:putative polyol transporter 2-like protein 1 [Colletotrichum chlorophyti]|uniref:Putative polyol transporter 2-like protein 1 n=1 Tax=Colletotrichum chlorophyti TaxID=708187 RepID=A0A1Q8RWB4_9PEZI|nr:putative polyol transporter 2-like protein 1 [Colletotrichum chlorophyti]
MSIKRIPNYVLASVSISLGGLANGLDTGCIGAIMAMPQFAGSVGTLSPFLVGFTVSLIMLTGGFPSVFAGHLADRFGRLKMNLAGAFLFGVGVLLQGTSKDLPQFLSGRALAGVGEGVFLGNMSVYICEIAPARHRGTLAGLPQFMATTGVCIGYFACYGTVGISSSMAWRLPYVVQGLCAVFFGLSCLMLPESPRWLLLQGRRADAVRSLERLEFSTAEAERDFLTASPSEQRLSLSPWQGVVLLFRRGYRARTVLALFTLGMVQLSGIDGVIYYAPILFSRAGLPGETAAFLASGLSAILMLAISVPAFLFADKWGRRTSAITGGVGLTSCMFLMGILYAAGVVHPHGAARWVVIIAVFVFGLTYCATWGIVGKIYASEIQPGNTRAAANCLATGLSFFTNWLVAMITPILLDKSAFGAYFLFGGLALGTTAVLATYMPETRGRSLENIQEAFHRPPLKGLDHYMRRLRPGHGRGPQPAQQSVSSGVELDARNIGGSAGGGTADVAPSGLRLDISSS